MTIPLPSLWTSNRRRLRLIRMIFLLAMEAAATLDRWTAATGIRVAIVPTLLPRPFGKNGVTHIACGLRNEGVSPSKGPWHSLGTICMFINSPSFFQRRGSLNSFFFRG